MQKINPKNAWSVNIIDYMKLLFHNRDIRGDSLQLATTSLDASAKVYAVRVDCIHSETIKLASNIERTDNQDDENGNYLKA